MRPDTMLMRSSALLMRPLTMPMHPDAMLMRSSALKTLRF